MKKPLRGPWLFSASGVRVVMRYMFDGYTHRQIGEACGCSGSYAGLILSGMREPSQCVLDVIGMERIVSYRFKDQGDQQ